MLLKLVNNEKNIKLAAKEIQKNNLVAFPTETVYGLGGSAYSEVAVNKIYDYKSRSLKNPLIAHYSNLEHIAEDCEINDICKALYKEFMPGPLTLVLKKKTNCSLVMQASANLTTQAVRVPDHQTALALIQHANVPIVAPSANISNKISPTLAEHVIQSFKDKNFILLDAGQTLLGLESTIVDISNNKNISILRHGHITKKDLQKLNIPVVQSEPTSILAPGMLYKHYSPNTPLYLSCKNLKEGDGLLAFGEINFTLPENIIIYNLSKTGNLKEAAKNLFKALWLLDGKKLNKICVMPIPNTGLGIAINEKLLKASYNNEQ